MPRWWRSPWTPRPRIFFFRWHDFFSGDLRCSPLHTKPSGVSAPPGMLGRRPLPMLPALRRRFLSMAMGLANPQQRVHVTEALTFVRALDFARFEASVDCVIKLNVDVKRTDERVRGMAFLPHGTGKAVRVAVFARGALALPRRARRAASSRRVPAPH